MVVIGLSGFHRMQMTRELGIERRHKLHFMTTQR